MTTALTEKETIHVDRCDHCDSVEQSLALDASPWTLVKCDACEFVFTSPRLSDAALAKIYSEEYYENANTYAIQQVEAPSDDHRALAATVKRMLRRQKTRLSSIDVGCGGGRLVEAFANVGFRATGVEPSEGTVQAARHAGRDVSVCDVSELQSERFDCVTAMHVLEHVPSPSDFMAHLFRITKPGGLCVIEVPNFESKAAKEQGADWYALHPSTHLSHFTPGSLANCMRKAGFDVTSMARLGGAGVFANVSEATARKSNGRAQPKNTTNRGLDRRLLHTVWSLRKMIISVSAVRRLARWVNWEVLGHGEFVRVFATRPNHRS